VTQLQKSCAQSRIKKDSYRVAVGNHPPRGYHTDTRDKLTAPRGAEAHPEWVIVLSRIRKERCFGRRTVEHLEGQPQVQGRALSGVPRLARCLPRVTHYPSGEHAKLGATAEGKPLGANGLGEKVQQRHPPRMTFAPNKPPRQGRALRNKGLGTSVETKKVKSLYPLFTDTRSRSLTRVSGFCFAAKGEA
jgi:hypothetical protein